MSRLLEQTIRAITPLNERSRQEALARHNRLTKPAGSLGRLEELGARICAITGQIPPKVDSKSVLVFAADHGVATEGVSAYPQEVTAQMVANFLQGGAAVNVLARQAGAQVLITEMGVAGPLPDDPRLIRRSLGPGTRNLAQEPAMSRATAVSAIEAGIEVAQQAITAGAQLLACGDMGIGNTTAATALTAVFTGLPPTLVVGRGTGIDDQRLAKKTRILQQALALHQPDPADPLGVLAAVGGFEIGAIAGAILAAAAHRVPLVLDGFIATSGALVAQALAPLSASFLAGGHRSAEPGHAAALEKLELTPLLDLGLRLGEGTGAVLAFHLVEAAARVIAEMATFDTAGVSEKSTSSTADASQKNAGDTAGIQENSASPGLTG